MTRIVAGAAGGRRLQVPAGCRTRPTAGRTREALFSSLGELAGARVLDLYAGTGAVGLEALSRGAHSAVLVERDPRVLETLRANVRAVGLPGAHLLAGPVHRVLRAPVPASLGPHGADLVFLDPPYAQPVDADLAALAAPGWLAAAAVVVVERSAHSPPPCWPPGLRPDRERRYGEARLWYGFRS